jgi:polyhydroxyalkanoate synthesis repressor PhaR
MSQTTPLRLIKRYGNRKLYDTSESRYITLDEIARLVRSGNDVKVIDNENGDDLTAITFAQIILEEEKRRSSLISLGLLRELVQHGEDTLAQLRTQVEKGVEAIGTIGEKAGRRMQEMVAGSVGGERADASHDAGVSSAAPQAEPGKGFFDELIAAPQRRLEALQRSIDERIKSSVGRITNHPMVQHEVQRIERSIKKLEERLARLRRDEDSSSRGNDVVG